MHKKTRFARPKLILIIAYGNDLREDDGAGLLLAERLEHAWQSLKVEVRRVVVRQLAPELAPLIVELNPRAIIFVDARMAGGQADGRAPESAAQARVAEPRPTHPAMEVSTTPIEARAPWSPSMGHHFDAGLLLAYAETLYGWPSRPAWLVTVPGVAFGFGEDLSDATLAAIRQAFEDETGAVGKLLGELSCGRSSASAIIAR